MKKKVYKRDGRAPIPVNTITSKLMSSNKAVNSKPEIILRKELFKAGIRGYRLHYNKIPGRPDITFVGKKIAIFVNGCFWHRCSKCSYPLPRSNVEFWRSKFEKNILRDFEKFDLLIKNEWKVITVWECEINNHIFDVIKKINKELKKNES